jgi:glutaminase
MFETLVDRRAQQVAAPSPIASYLDELLERHAGRDTGEVATYIPELASADPDLFGICLATVDGALYEAGDTRAPFTIQSMSKPLTYGLALELAGEEAVRSRVGVEPSGDPFNEISLRAGTGTPVNPMINAGAITCAGLVFEASDAPMELLLETYSTYAGRPLEIDEAVYRSEADTGHRNRAIAHLLRGHEVLVSDPEAALDLYFRQCSVNIDCRDLALVAATLANGGVNPVTGVRAVREDVVRSILSVMTTCGMYDGAGEWLVSVGIPAKSGVSGGVLGVLPGRLGVAVFSPRLDEQGNSVRGVAVCRDLSQDLALHLIRPGERSAAPIRTTYRLGQRNSKRQRTAGERAAIRANAETTAVFELQGDLDFMGAEAISRALLERDESPELVVIDLRRVNRVDRAGGDFLAALAASLSANDGKLAVSGSGDVPESGEIIRFELLDLALEWCEDEVLARLAHDEHRDEIAVDRHRLLDGLTADELDMLLPRLGSVTAPAGTTIVLHGDPADELFLVTSGRLSVFAPGGDRRLTTLSAGMTFGELAYIERGPRTANVVADTDVECRTLTYELFDELSSREPEVYGKLLRNILAVVAASLHLANAELSHLGS